MKLRSDFLQRNRYTDGVPLHIKAMHSMECILYSLGFLLLFSCPVHAYIDPSVMTYAIQAVAGIAIASGTFVGLLWRRMRRKIIGSHAPQESKYKETENDELLYTEKDVPYEIMKRSVEHERLAAESGKGRPAHKLSWSERLGDIVPIALMLVVTFGVFIPSSLYLGNVNEFIFDYMKDVLPLLLGVSCIVFTAIELLVSIFPGRLYLILSSLVFSLGLGFYIQGNFMNPKFAILNGTEMDWSSFASYTTTGTIVWALVFIIPLVLVLWKTKAARAARTGVSLFLAAVQIVSLFYMDVNTKKDIASDVFVTKVGEWDLSKNNNTVVFIVDTLDARWMEDYIMSDPVYSGYVKDFTFYNDCVGGGAPTIMGVPLLLTGRNYMSDRMRGTYYQEAYEASHLFRDIANAGKKTKLFTSYEYISYADLEYVENVEPENNLVIGDTLGFIQQIYKLTSFYAMPMQLKENFWLHDSSTFNKMAASVANKDPMFTLDDPQMRQDLDSSGVDADLDEDLFVMYHMFGAHGPARMNEKGERVPDSFEEADIIAQIKGSFNIINDVMNQMKALGVYDNSTFIIMADHGGVELYQNPAVLIKKAGETHDAMQVSDAPITFQNVRATIADAMLSDEQQTEEYGKRADEVTMEDNQERLHTATRVLGVQYYPDDPYVTTKEFSVYKFHGKARDLDQVEVLPIERFYGEHE